MVRISLLGGMAVEVDGDGDPAALSRRARALLAWLALNPGEHPRSEVAALFWPDVLDASARTSLRGALLELRRALGPEIDCLRATRSTVGLTNGESLWVDALEVERLVAEGRLEEALDLGSRDLLPGLEDDWAYAARDAHRERMVEIAEGLARRAEEQGDLAAAVSFSRRNVALDPLSEDAHRNLIRRLAAGGDTPAALKAYEAMSARFRRELGVAPGAATRELVQRLREEQPPAEPGEVTLPLPPAIAANRDEMVGREDDLAALNSALEATAKGEARVVLVGGDAGVGKTRLTSEFARAAYERGTTVLFGRCDEEALAPYQPWVESLRHYVVNAASDELRRSAGSAAAELARLLPVLSDRLPDLPEPMRAEPDTERYRLFEGVAGLLAGVASARPVVLVLEDLHWADRPTLLLLRHAVRAAAGTRLLIVGTYRENEVDAAHPLGQALTELRREPVYVRLSLTGLRQQDVAKLVSRRLEADDDFVSALHAETEGNPFFIGEILQSLPDAGLPESPPNLTHVALPEGVKEAIGRRLDRLAARTHEALSVAAIVGSEFDLTIVEAATDAGRGELVDALDEAVHAQLVVEAPDRPGRYSFKHALIRATLEEALTRTRRASLHLEVGAVLAHLRGGSDDPPFGELAHHYLEAGPLAAPGEAVRYCVLAAEQASRQLAYEEAAIHLHNALGALDADGEQRISLEIALGDAELRAGETERAREAYARAFAAAEAHERGDFMARAALGFAGPAWQSFGDVDSEAIQMLRAALDGLSPGALHAETQARLAAALFFAEGGERIATMSDEALTMARAAGEPTALAAAMEARFYALWRPGGGEERVSLATELLALAERARQVELAAQARRWRVVALLERGVLDEAANDIAAHAELAQALGQPYELMYTKVFEGMQALYRGAFGDAAARATEIVSGEHGQPGADALQFYGLQMLTLTHACGGIEQLEPALRDYLARFPGTPGWRAGIVLILSETGRREEARAELTRLAADHYAIFPEDPNWMPAMAWLALACRDVGDADQASSLHRVLLRHEGEPCVIGAGGALWGTTHLYLGMTSARAGDIDAAVAHLETEIAWNRDHGGRPWVAQAQAALGEALLGSGDPRGDRLLDEAAATAAELGMAVLSGRIEAGRAA